MKKELVLLRGLRSYSGSKPNELPKMSRKPHAVAAAESVAILGVSVLSLLLGPISVSRAEPPARSSAPVICPFEEPPLPPCRFNPDPGGKSHEPEPAPVSLFADPVFPPDYGTDPVAAPLKLPRGDLQEVVPLDKTYHYLEYPLASRGEGLPPHTEAKANRWFLGFTWKRYLDPSDETPYMYESPRLWHPYRQSILKGDSPIYGNEIFAAVTFKNFSLFEFRKLPTPSGVSTARPNSSEFFGRSQQALFGNDTTLTFDLFKGETSFKPVDWALHVSGVYNVNYIRVKENNALDPDPRGVGYPAQSSPNISQYGPHAPKSGNVNPVIPTGDINAGNIDPGDLVDLLTHDLTYSGKSKPLLHVHKTEADLAGSRTTTRTKDFFALQEAFAEVHLRDLSENYDFVSTRVGIQPFVSDFRGFIFSDTNLGVRLFGNAANNHYQYNLAYFDMREKDTYSDLNTFDNRDQDVFIANLYKQDFFAKGYTAQWSLHVSLDHGANHFDKNDFISRPALIGDAAPHDVNSYYLGWAGDGHIGRFNVSHAVYEVLGEDQHNGLAGQKVNINAQMAALEISLDKDWLRYKLSGFYASGDADPTDRTARGFDSILDAPVFIGGPFSWYAHQGFNLAGTAVGLKQRDSLVPDLRSSKSEGQANFVNPGATILGAGIDADLTPKLRLSVNINYIWLNQTEPIKLALQTNKASNDLGLDCSIGFRYRPLLTENIILSAGIGFLFPGEGYKDIYRTNTSPVPGFPNYQSPGKVDSFLYNGFMTVTFLF